MRAASRGPGPLPRRARAIVVAILRRASPDERSHWVGSAKGSSRGKSRVPRRPIDGVVIEAREARGQ
eukprot:1457710-Lingulodinium_polyedra.AAC.1